MDEKDYEESSSSSSKGSQDKEKKNIFQIPVSVNHIQILPLHSSVNDINQN